MEVFRELQTKFKSANIVQKLIDNLDKLKKRKDNQYLFININL